MGKITVIGSFVLDMVATVDEFPREGQTILGKSLRSYPGGKGANQCVAAARLGADAEMVGMVGNDDNGRFFVELFKKEGIRCDKIFFTDAEPTAVAQIQINAKSENKIVMIPSANHVFSPIELNKAQESIKNSDIVMAQLELTHEVTKEIVRLCALYKVPLILNPAPAYKLDSEILCAVDYLTPNETELEILSGHKTQTDEDVAAAAKILLDIGVKNIVATLGSRGAMIANADGVRIIGGYKVKVCDTVAAGDSFNGALAVALSGGKSLDEAVRFANAVGAITVTRRGAIPSLPTLSEVEAFIRG